MKMGYVLGVALVGAVTVGFVADRAGKKSPIQKENPATAAMAQSGMAEAPAEDGAAIRGTVIESFDVPQYTYLHLDTGKDKQWAAVPSAKVAKGDVVAVVNAARMENFQSPTLKRTFDVIYFGTLGDGAVSPGGGGALPAGHPAVGAGMPPAGMPMADGTAMPPGHPNANAPTEDVPVPKVDKAKGDNAERVADVYASLSKLAGKKIRVRGAVVKVTPGINGKTFLHLRDGSGDAQKRTNDLVATTKAEPKKGDVITLEGTLSTDVDIGIGYHYPALLEDSVILEN